MSTKIYKQPTSVQ